MEKVKCETSTITKQSLPEHTNNECRKCKLKFASKDGLKWHEIRFHEIKKKCHNCVFCEAKFHTRNELYSHIHRHVKERPYSCEYCQESFASTTDRTRHIERYHLQPSTKDFECKYCPNKFYNLEGLKTHLKRHLPQASHLKHVNKKYKCLFCSASFVTVVVLNDHTLRHIQEKPYFCRSCDNCFGSSGERKNHFTRHHGGNINVHKCDICGSKFASIENVKYHKFKWHSSNSFPKERKVFKCDICSKHLLSKQAHRYHMQIHSQEKPFQCNLCSYKCRSTSALSIHLKTHTKEKPNKCKICGAEFSRTGSLTTHVKEMHEQLHKWNCLFCNEKLFTRFYYLEHIIKHTQEKPYHCKNCGKELPKKSQLKCHLRMHERVANIVCGICDQSFHQQSSMRYHRMKHFYMQDADGWSCRICRKTLSTQTKTLEHLKNEHKNDLNKFATAKLITMTL